MDDFFFRQAYPDCFEPTPQQELDWAIHSDHADVEEPEEERDYYAEAVEERFQRVLERGRVEGDTFITPTGAKINTFKAMDNDEDIVWDSCSWCDGTGEGGDAQGLDGDCDACRDNPGRGAKRAQGIIRKERFLDEVFFADAPRAELMDRDICPECKGGGCGGECQFTAEEWARFSGEDPDDHPNQGLTEADVLQYETDLDAALKHMSDQIPF